MINVGIFQAYFIQHHNRIVSNSEHNIWRLDLQLDIDAADNHVSLPINKFQNKHCNKCIMLEGFDLDY